MLLAPLGIPNDDAEGMNRTGDRALVVDRPRNRQRLRRSRLALGGRPMMALRDRGTGEQECSQARRSRRHSLERLAEENDDLVGGIQACAPALAGRAQRRLGEATGVAHVTHVTRRVDEQAGRSRRVAASTCDLGLC